MNLFDMFIAKIVNYDSLLFALKMGLKFLIILLFTLILIKIINKILQRFENYLVNKSRKENESLTESQKRIETIVRLVKQATMIFVWVIVALIILSEIGVKIGPLLASAGIVGLAVGFGAQNLVRDVIAGFFIILENQVRVGDVAIVNGTGGLVEKINFRTIILRDLAGIVHVFPNGTITSLSNLTNQWSAYIFEIGVAYKENTDHVIKIMTETGLELKEDENLGKYMLEEPEIFGVDKLADSSVIIKGRIRTLPIKQWLIGREYLRRIKLAFDKNKIEIPFPHRTVYFGEKSKPIDVLLKEKDKA